MGLINPNEIEDSVLNSDVCLIVIFICWVVDIALFCLVLV